MTSFLTTDIGRFRLLAFLEGLSLLILVFISVPLKKLYGITEISTVVGPIHGLLFLLFIVLSITVGAAYDWKFRETTWKVILASFIPFGTFYIDAKILEPLHKRVVG